MRWGIVGAERAKFTAAGMARARYEISALLRPGDVVVTGACPRGGVDIWAEEIGHERGLEVVVHKPLTRDWPGFQRRNILIAEDYEEGVCFTPRKLPPGYRGRHTRNYCYHCDTTEHVVSGGCWTIQYGRKLGKPGRVIVID